ncbi:MAG: hypothetical protein Tsb0015_10910 [Simkaniaceae bacterium]
MDIPYKGYLYTGAQPFFKEVREEIIQFQFRHLLEKKEWISDEEAQERIWGAAAVDLSSDN